jgi:hypothetical protein
MPALLRQRGFFGSRPLHGRRFARSIRARPAVSPAIPGLGMAFERIAFLLLLAAQGVTAPAHGLERPALCERLESAGARQPDEVRRYRMRLNDQPAGHEVFRFWREGDTVRVVVETALEGDILMFPADFRHCREERWLEAGAQLLELEAATTYAVPFKPDYEVRIERDPARDEVVYRGRSSLGSFEERHPANTGAVSPWSIRTVAYARLLNVFEHGVHPTESSLVGRATIDGSEVQHYAMGGQWPRHLWYQDGKMIRFCGREAFDTYIETVLEAYADRAIAAAGLSRSCGELFE